ncbi:guanine-1-methyltransferase-domain-containing protein [Armillaria fumosa]|nr:guanine-1-methyltransferase-domain-containing protein [Armillaria fumosa]
MDSPATPVTPALSKSARKKAERNERLAATKLERRAKEKAAKKEKRRIKAEKRAAGELDSADEAERERKKKKPKLEFGGRILIDLGFDDKMLEKEINSLCSQLAYTYSANRQASFPFSLICSSLNGRTRDRLEANSDAAYKRWVNTEWWEEGYERLWSGDVLPVEPGAERGNVPGNRCPETSATADPAQSVRQSIVYLTADSEEELTELRPNETYIIGGIVDRNRYKNLCLEKAKESDIRTAALPIGRYLENLPTRKVLTVNQVFEIMLKWVETRDWEISLYAVIPKRKFLSGGKHGEKEGSAVVTEEDVLEQSEVTIESEV